MTQHTNIVYANNGRMSIDDFIADIEAMWFTEEELSLCTDHNQHVVQHPGCIFEITGAPTVMRC